MTAKPVKPRSQPISYDERVERILKTRQLDTELHNAERYAKTLRTLAKNCKDLTSKIALLAKADSAKEVLRQLRRNYFDIEDQLAETQHQLPKGN